MKPSKVCVITKETRRKYPSVKFLTFFAIWKYARCFKILKVYASSSVIFSHFCFAFCHSRFSSRKFSFSFVAYSSFRAWLSQQHLQPSLPSVLFFYLLLSPFLFHAFLSPQLPFLLNHVISLPSFLLINSLSHEVCS